MSDQRPILIIPYVWIGDFVRCHSVVKLLRAQAPDRAVDIVTSTLCAPLADYMPGIRNAISADLPRRRLGFAHQVELAHKLRTGDYSQVLIMSRKWKAAFAPFLAAIPVRTGFIGEARFGLLNDLRWGESRLPRMIDQMGTLALPKGAARPSEWPIPELNVPSREVAEWSTQRGFMDKSKPIIALAPGAVGTGKAWPPIHYADLANRLVCEGASVWILGGLGEAAIAKHIVETAGNRVHDLTSNDLRNAILALIAADISVTNDSGLMHVSAAIGTPTIAIFGPTSPWHWKPLNPLAAILEPPGNELAREHARLQGNDAVSHRRTADVSVETVLEAIHKVLKKQQVDSMER